MLKKLSAHTYFSRLLVTYLIIIIFTMTMLGIILGQFYKNYYYSEIEKNLTSQGREINNLLLAFYKAEISSKSMVEQLSLTEHLSNAHTLIADQNGVIYWASSGNIVGSRLTPDVYATLTKGRTATFVTKGKNNSKEDLMSVGVPLMVNGRFMGATLFHTSLTGIQSRISQVYWLIVLAALISSVIAIILIYFISRRISEPIREMTKVSMAMAGGDFSQKVTVQSNDEIGYLAVTFNHMVTELGRLEQMRKDFIANVSHELRSPLTSIRGFIQGVIDGTVDREEQNKYLQIALDETNRLSRLVTELLDLARMEAGNLELNPESIKIKELLNETVDRMGFQAANKGVKMAVEAPDDLLVLADRDRIEQVIINLLDNAVRFTYPDGQIKVSARAVNNKAYITVQDNGIGIPEDELDNIWDRFYKCDKARTRAKGGTGLGLAIIRHLIKAHNEDITVESKVGEGTAFTFTLPLVLE